MARLTPEIDVNLNLPIIKQLELKNIFTVLDFLEEDADRLCTITGLVYKNIIEIRRQILSKFSAKSNNGLECYKKMLVMTAKINTGIKKLDDLLEGGMLTGNIYEICGLSGIGKTQLCFTIASHVTTNLKQPVYYVDTKHDFSSQRILQIMRTHHFNDMEIQAAMENLKVTRVNDIYEMITFLHSLGSMLENMPCRLIIVDSITALFTPFLNEQRNDGLGLLNHVAATMKRISVTYQTVFVTVNLATSFIDNDDLDGQQTADVCWYGDIRPKLGKAWMHMPASRLLMHRESSMPDHERIVTLIKSTDLQLAKKCVLKVTSSGLEG
ncbi:DNA repair protein RAD51 homolog 4 [Nilaparvata lugens]|uniref:DNA repair protein RAD51 homolog 4 n=1 Tax=Nilaparvata lugens TaxID=108931 RepID=UPI00193E155F|nr:DNA repair protein RAD51 homolog 4 [Nilaparvata lugens]